MTLDAVLVLVPLLVVVVVTSLWLRTVNPSKWQCFIGKNAIVDGENIGK